MDVFTPFEELDAVLGAFTDEVRRILGATFVGAYLQGSFALDAADLDSDCDFIVAATVLPSGRAEAELRRLHAEMPAGGGRWAGRMEGSYADVGSLRGIDGLGTAWLFCNHAYREVNWDTHCNSIHTRWILRNHGLALAGPPAADLVDEISPQVVRDAMRAALPGFMSRLSTWADFDVAWTQRYAVATYCRVLYSVHTGMVTSKRGALEWACESLDPGWQPLLRQVIADRGRGLDPAERPRPGSVEATLEFAAYAESFGAADPLGPGHPFAVNRVDR